MIRAQFLLAACLVMAVLTQNGDQDGVKSLLNPSEEARIQAEVAEIMAIRKRLGGGVSEQLKGFSIEMPAGKTGGTQVPDRSEPMSIEEAFTKQLTRQSRNSTAQTQSANKWTLEAIAEEPAKLAQPHRESVRHAARMLEEAAAILEEANEYDQADKVRQTAGELWRTARLR